jgi:RND family efflux transporter MFP subunit
LSHAAWFERRSALAVLLEDAMTEAIEQRELLTWPTRDDGDTVLVVQAQQQLAADGAAVTVPILAGARAVGAITWQLPSTLVSDEFIAECRALAVVLGPILARLDDQSRWLSGSAVAAVVRGWRALTDPRRPSFAVGTTLFLAVFAWVALVDTSYRVTAKAVLEGQLQRVVAAPFEGFVAEAPVRAGQTVSRGALLARLDDRDLRLEQTRLAAELTQNERKRDEALAARDKAAISVAAAQVAEVEARLAQVEDRLLRTRIEAPFDGVVVSGDLSQSIGGPVEQGKTLFELAPMSGYRVVLKVDERDVRRVSPGQRGELVLSGTSGEKQAFTVRNVSTAGVDDGRNVFRVEAELDAANTKLRPGMEGVGKLVVGEETLLWIWTHRLVNWVRMALWRYLP